MDKSCSVASDGKESACNVKDPGSIPQRGRSPGDGNGYLFQHSCLDSILFGQRRLAGYILWGQRVGHDWATNTFSFLWIKPSESEDLSMGTHCPPPSPRARGRGVQKKAKQATGSNVHHRPIILLTSPFPIRRSRDGVAPQNSWESEEGILNWSLAVENRGWDLVVRKRKYQTKKGR